MDRPNMDKLLLIHISSVIVIGVITVEKFAKVE
uniref:Uncharacterized protein n=1 Tax=Tetranychus urticae TaxID=32264 RepID=T1L0U0_TETUR